jgi:hypothetical protein
MKPTSVCASETAPLLDGSRANALLADAGTAEVLSRRLVCSQLAAALALPKAAGNVTKITNSRKAIKII